MYKKVIITRNDNGASRYIELMPYYILAFDKASREQESRGIVVLKYEYHRTVSYRCRRSQYV